MILSNGKYFAFDNSFKKYAYKTQFSLTMERLQEECVQDQRKAFLVELLE